MLELCIFSNVHFQINEGIVIVYIFLQKILNCKKIILINFRVMDDDNFNLYDDLDEALIEPLENERIKHEGNELEKIESEKRTKNESDEKLLKLEIENNQLKKNISLLLATAKSEIER